MSEFQNPETEKLNQKAFEVAKNLNGLSVSEARYVVQYIDRYLSMKSVVNFDFRPGT